MKPLSLPKKNILPTFSRPKHPSISIERNQISIEPMVKHNRISIESKNWGNDRDSIAFENRNSTV